MHPAHPCLTCHSLDGYFWRPFDRRGTAYPWRCSVCDPRLPELVQVTGGIDRPETLGIAIMAMPSEQGIEPELFDIDEESLNT